MSLILASATLAAAMIPACSWNQPGRNPYRGTPAEAVSRYVDIPPATRAVLAERIARGEADDDVVITRDAILGRNSYAPQISSMHFGRRTVCERVTRERWAADARQPAKVYCADGTCLIVPKICGNVSRIRTLGAGKDLAGTAADADRLRQAAADEAAPEADIEAADAIAELASPLALLDALPTLEDLLGEEEEGNAKGRAAFGFGMPVVELPVDVDDTIGGPVSPVPEPAGWIMFLVGAGTLILYSRYR